MKNVIGIDLGTTNCCVAIVENGRPKVIEDEKGYNILPSYIAIKGSNKFIVGHGAKAQAISNPVQTLRAVKRLIGRKINTPEVEEARKRMNFEILEGPNYDVLLRMGGMTLTPVDASSILLKCIKGIAEKHLGREVNEAVITCPAYFTNAQRKATIEAGQKAGLKVLRLLNEPTAAALAYGYKKDINKKLLIYDLGGGTFDVSILEVGNNVYEVLATNGDSYLGGEDLDYRLVDHLVANFRAQNKIDLRGDKMALQRLKDAAERAKCELSFVDKTQIMIPHIHATSNLQAELTREELEKLTEDLITKTFNVVARTLEEANLVVGDVDDVILVGGQTRMPRIQEMVKSMFGKPPCKGVHPDEAVAIGAAVHADALTEDKGNLLLLDVTPFSLGIDSAGDIFTRIVSKNATIPVAESRTFTTVMDNQEKVKIVVRQGEAKKATDNTFLGEFVLTGIRRAPKMEPKIDVVFRIDSNGILNVSAKDRFTGERQSILIKDYFERATNPESAASEGAVEGGETPTEISAVEGEGAPAETAAGKARGLFRRLVGGLSKGAKKEGVPEEATAVEGASELPVEQQSNMPAESTSMAPAGGAREVAASSPPPPPRPSAPSFDPYGVVPADSDAVQKRSETPRAAAPAQRRNAPPPPVTPTWDTDPFAQAEKGRTFTNNYTDPFAVAEKGSFEPRPDPFAMNGGMADPFAFDGADPFAIAEKKPARAGGSAGAGSGSATEDLLGSLDLDKLVDELAEGMPTVSGQVGEVGGKPRRNVAGLAEGGNWSGWQAPSSMNGGLEDAFALAEAGVDPFAVMERSVATRPATGPSGDAYAPSAASSAGSNGLKDSSAPIPMGNPVSGHPNLPTGFLDDKPNLPTGFLEEKPDLPTGFLDEKQGGAAQSGVVNGGTALDSERAAAGAKKKPARLKIAYKRIDAFVSEYSENLSRGGTFIKTPSPLDLGRECLFELTIPNRDNPILLKGVVVWSSKGLSSLEAGQEAGMGIKYLFDDAPSKRKIEQILDDLRVGGV